MPGGSGAGFGVKMVDAKAASKAAATKTDATQGREGGAVWSRLTKDMYDGPNRTNLEMGPNGCRRARNTGAGSGAGARQRVAMAISAEARTLFKLMDANNDGLIDESEAKAVSHSLGCNSRTFWNLMRKYDSDNDGKICLLEFDQAMQGRILAAFFPGDSLRDYHDLIVQATMKLKEAAQEKRKKANEVKARKAATEAVYPAPGGFQGVWRSDRAEAARMGPLFDLGSEEIEMRIPELTTKVTELKKRQAQLRANTKADTNDVQMVAYELEAANEDLLYAREQLDELRNHTLFWASANADLATVKAMLAKGADPRTTWSMNGGIDGYTPLHVAVHTDDPVFLSDRLKIVKALLFASPNGTNPNAKNGLGHTPLHEMMMAATSDQCEMTKRHVEIVEVLLAKGADPNATDDRPWLQLKEGSLKTPLHCAAMFGHAGSTGGDTAVVKALRAAGGQWKKKDYHGRTPESYAEEFERKGYCGGCGPGLAHQTGSVTSIVASSCDNTHERESPGLPRDQTRPQQEARQEDQGKRRDEGGGNKPDPTPPVTSYTASTYIPSLHTSLPYILDRPGGSLDDCGICMKPCQRGAAASLEAQAVQPFRCRHAFHHECIHKWMSSSEFENLPRQSPRCPTCIKLFEAQRELERRQKSAPVDTTPGRTALRGHTFEVFSVCALGEARLASGSYDNSIIVWDVDKAAKFKTLTGHTDSVRAVCALGKAQLASGSSDKSVIIWDVDKATQLKTFTGHTGYVNSVCALGKAQLASGSSDKSIIVWDVDEATKLSTLTGHTGSVNSVCALGKAQLASGSDDKSVMIWDVDKATQLKTFTGHTGYVRSVCALGKAQLASGCNDKSIIVWDVDKAAKFKTLTGHSSSVRAVCALGETQLASGSDDKSVMIWDVDKATQLKTFTGHTGFVRSVCALGKAQLASGSYDTSIIVWDAKGKQ